MIDSCINRSETKSQIGLQNDMQVYHITGVCANCCKVVLLSVSDGDRYLKGRLDKLLRQGIL